MALCQEGSAGGGTEGAGFTLATSSACTLLISVLYGHGSAARAGDAAIVAASAAAAAAEAAARGTCGCIIVQAGVAHRTAGRSCGAAAGRL